MKMKVKTKKVIQTAATMKILQRYLFAIREVKMVSY